MNKQCQQPQAHPDRCGCVREIAEHNAQAYAEAIAALAARDQRIAELEAENAHMRHGMRGDYDLDAWLEWCAKVDATPSEDGREVPEVVAYVDEHGTTVSIGRQGAWISGHDRAIPDCWDKLMTVAQHSRIVAAKNAEIARLTKLAYIGEHQHEDCTYKFRLEELRAQPARQVGDDCYVQAVPEHCDRITWRGHYYSLPPLAPAAVVMPERMAANNWGGGYEHGFNAALDEVARLNRNVIPLELLEWIVRKPYHPDECMTLDRGSAIDELRALLGKS